MSAGELQIFRRLHDLLRELRARLNQAALLGRTAAREDLPLGPDGLNDDVVGVEVVLLDALGRRRLLRLLLRADRDPGKRETEGRHHNLHQRSSADLTISRMKSARTRIRLPCSANLRAARNSPSGLTSSPSMMSASKS